MQRRILSHLSSGSAEMSVVAEGQRVLDGRPDEASVAQFQYERDRRFNEERTISRFRGKFFRRHYKATYHGRVEDPDNPFPPITEWRLLDRSKPLRGRSTFMCEGLAYECEWKYRRQSARGDYAYWDDGWWETFYLVLPRRLWFGNRRIYVRAPEDVARAVA